MSTQPQQSTMTTIHNRPTRVLEYPQSVDGLYISCRTTSGEDVYVPLRDIYSLFVNKIRRNTNYGNH